MKKYIGFLIEHNKDEDTYELIAFKRFVDTMNDDILKLLSRHGTVTRWLPRVIKKDIKDYFKRLKR